jgi:hypothetical protein
VALIYCRSRLILIARYFLNPFKMSAFVLDPPYNPYTASIIGVQEAYLLGCIVQCSIVFSGYVMGSTFAILPKNREARLVYWLGVFSVLHGASIAIGVFSTNLVGSLVPIYDSSPYIATNFPALQKLGGYSWTLTGIAADYAVALLTFKKLLYLLLSSRLISYNSKKHWFIPHIGAAFFSGPGIAQTIWVYFALVQQAFGVRYDDHVGKYLVTARLFLIKGNPCLHSN